MDARFSSKYIIGTVNGNHPKYIIAPPLAERNLDGYVMKIPKENIQLESDSFVFLQGNEWDKVRKEYVYMFEKAVKIKGRAIKRYRYTQEQLDAVYRNASFKTS